jgi:hypothetical protein|tara:strand:+ start:3002 stop:3307 length:306 start_codon:yes stop_codon:yes gene_type:complete
MAGPAYPSTHRVRGGQVDAMGEYNSLTLVSGSQTAIFTGSSAVHAGAAILPITSASISSDAVYHLTNGGHISSSHFLIDTIHPIGVRKVVQTTGYTYVLHK